MITLTVITLSGAYCILKLTLPNLVFTRLAQTSPGDVEDDFGSDIVASICAGVEERGWDAKQLLHALLDGGKHSLFDAAPTATPAPTTTCANPDGA